jgi:hypothetical protein
VFVIYAEVKEFTDLLVLEGADELLVVERGDAFEP